jgi:hypothetical protein
VATIGFVVCRSSNNSDTMTEHNSVAEMATARDDSQCLFCVFFLFVDDRKRERSKHLSFIDRNIPQSNSTPVYGVASPEAVYDSLELSNTTASSGDYQNLNQNQKFVKI